MGNIKLAKERSVNHLQQLYTVVVSLAVTQCLLVLTTKTIAYEHALMFTSFVVTVIPFYHGANRYLDATYVSGERSAKHFALLFDFIALFTEGVIFFLLALNIKDLEVFYSILAGLFIFDSVWVGLTNLWAVGSDTTKSYLKWAGTNVVSAVTIFIFSWSNIFSLEIWENNLARNIALCAVPILRTVYDYKSAWKFYYPEESKQD